MTLTTKLRTSLASLALAASALAPQYASAQTRSATGMKCDATITVEQLSKSGSTLRGRQVQLIDLDGEPGVERSIVTDNLTDKLLVYASHGGKVVPTDDAAKKLYSVDKHGRTLIDAKLLYNNSKLAHDTIFGRLELGKELGGIRYESTVPKTIPGYMCNNETVKIVVRPAHAKPGASMESQYQTLLKEVQASEKEIATERSARIADSTAFRSDLDKLTAKYTGQGKIDARQDAQIDSARSDIKQLTGIVKGIDTRLGQATQHQYSRDSTQKNATNQSSSNTGSQESDANQGYILAGGELGKEITNKLAGVGSVAGNMESCFHGVIAKVAGGNNQIYLRAGAEIGSICGTTKVNNPRGAINENLTGGDNKYVGSVDRVLAGPVDFGGDITIRSTNTAGTTPEGVQNWTRSMNRMDAGVHLGVGSLLNHAFVGANKTIAQSTHGTETTAGMDAPIGYSAGLEHNGLTLGKSPLDFRVAGYTVTGNNGVPYSRKGVEGDITFRVLKRGDGFSVIAGGSAFAESEHSNQNSNRVSGRGFLSAGYHF